MNVLWLFAAAAAYVYFSRRSSSKLFSHTDNADGTFTLTCPPSFLNGLVLAIHPDGSTSQPNMKGVHNLDHSIDVIGVLFGEAGVLHVNPDGSAHITFQDGSRNVLAPDGSVSHFDPLGQVIA